MKTRTFPENNYKAIFTPSGKTLRIPLDSGKPVTAPKFKEFYDIKLTDYCTGNCPYCYMDSTKKGKHAKNAEMKVFSIFGRMSENERPFQVAIGGGEPTKHPKFYQVLRAFHALGIMPNITTNGMWGIIPDGIEQYCGGVAVSAHKHLEHFWTRAVERLLAAGIKTNIHVVISDMDSVDYLIKWRKQYPVDYWVLLPYGAQGRAEEKAIDWEYLDNNVDLSASDIAYGAGFYPYLKDRPDLDVSLYEPEMFSAYIDLVTMTQYPSSFNLDHGRNI